MINKMDSADIVIIGGGIIGLACAESLSRSGMKVILLERLGLASGSSGASQGGVGLEPFMDDYDLQLHLAGIATYKEFLEKGIDLGFQSVGGLVVAKPEEESNIKHRLMELQKKNVRCEWLDKDALINEEPNISPSAFGAILFHDYSQTHPIETAIELARQAKRHGAVIYTGEELTGIEITHGRIVAANTVHGRIPTDRILIAAGSWSADVSKYAGVSIPVYPLKGHVLVTEPISGLLNHFITETAYEESANIMRKVQINKEGPRSITPLFAAAIQNLKRGEILIGSSREFVGFDRSVNRRRIKEIAKKACHLVPCLGDIRVIRTYAGLRPWTPDGRPIIGKTQLVDGLWFATGHSGEGNTLALFTARLITDLVLNHKPELDPTPLNPDRFTLIH